MRILIGILTLKLKDMNRVIPTLTGDTAERFCDIVKENNEKKGSIDFTEESKTCRKILNKSNTQFVFWDDMWNKSKEK